MYQIIDMVVTACSSSFATFVGGIAALYGIDWYKNRRLIRKSNKKLIAEEGYTTRERVAEQLA